MDRVHNWNFDNSYIVFMKKRILLLMFIPIVYFGYKYFSEKPFLKITEFKEGRWISTVDPLSGIEIKNGKWIIFYKGNIFICM